MKNIFTKKELRKIYKDKRMTLSKDEVVFLSETIFKKFILQFKFIEFQNVSVFLTIDKFKEIDTELFINYFLENNIRLFVPKVFGDEMLVIEVFSDSEFEISDWGIKEPKGKPLEEDLTFDFVFTPLLYCDQYGNRIGYGKGYYDKFFTNNKVKNKIGLSFFEPNELIEDVSQDDIKLDGLLTPNSFIKFK